MRKVAYVEDVALVSLQHCPAEVEFFAHVLSAISNEGVDIDMISQSPPSGGHIDVFFTVMDSDVPQLLTVMAGLKKAYPTVRASINGNNSKISVYDDAMRQQPGYAAEVFAAAASVGAEIRLVTTSEVDISLLVVNSYVQDLVDKLTRNQ